MAKWVENDPRWIVSNRQDGQNVNNWHWTESDYSGWARNKLKSLLEGQVIDEPDKFSVKISELTLEGEVSVNTRKQKAFLFYELNLSFKWSGVGLPSNKEGKGSVNVPYISEENDDDEFEVKVSIDDESSNDLSKLKSDFRTAIIKKLKIDIPDMLKELREAALSKTKLVPKEQPSAKLLDKVAPIIVPKEHTETKKSSTISSSTSFTITEKFVCSCKDLYDTLLLAPRVRAYAGGDSTISPDIGNKFKLFGGSVEGEIIELVPYSRIVQKWRFSSLPKGHYSIVKIELEEKSGKTILKLEQSGVPDEDRERTEAGWRENFWRRIKGIFGYGPLL